MKFSLHFGQRRSGATGRQSGGQGRGQLQNVGQATTGVGRECPTAAFPRGGADGAGDADSWDDLGSPVRKQGMDLQLENKTAVVTGSTAGH
ncbi:MAG: hypothetical protein H0U23_09115 [Blastocatellia bacterium]|nr:hypothetical protein [Blastocatellia bacterium]